MATEANCKWHVQWLDLYRTTILADQTVRCIRIKNSGNRAWSSRSEYQTGIVQSMSDAGRTLVLLSFDSVVIPCISL